jgi:hypothetical protein
MKIYAPIISALIASLATCLLPAQMELRWSGLFGPTKFEATSPKINTFAPDLLLWDIEGRPKSLQLERGRTIVLIGASYT